MYLNELYTILDRLIKRDTSYYLGSNGYKDSPIFIKPVNNLKCFKHFFQNGGKVCFLAAIKIDNKKTFEAITPEEIVNFKIPIIYIINESSQNFIKNINENFIYTLEKE